MRINIIGPNKKDNELFLEKISKTKTLIDFKLCDDKLIEDGVLTWMVLLSPDKDWMEIYYNNKDITLITEF